MKMAGGDAGCETECEKKGADAINALGENPGWGDRIVACTGICKGCDFKGGKNCTYSAPIGSGEEIASRMNSMKSDAEGYCTPRGGPAYVAKASDCKGPGYTWMPKGVQTVFGGRRRRGRGRSARRSRGRSARRTRSAGRGRSVRRVRGARRVTRRRRRSAGRR